MKRPGRNLARSKKRRRRQHRRELDKARRMAERMKGEVRYLGKTVFGLDWGVKGPPTIIATLEERQRAVSKVMQNIVTNSIFGSSGSSSSESPSESSS